MYASRGRRLRDRSPPPQRPKTPLDLYREGVVSAEEVIAALMDRILELEDNISILTAEE